MWRYPSFSLVHKNLFPSLRNFTSPRRLIQYGSASRRITAGMFDSTPIENNSNRFCTRFIRVTYTLRESGIQPARGYLSGSYRALTPKTSSCGTIGSRLVSNCRYAIDFESGDHQYAVDNSSSSGYTQSRPPLISVSDPSRVSRVSFPLAI